MQATLAMRFQLHIRILKSDQMILIAHTDEFREAAKSELGDQALITGAKALASTGYNC